MQDLEFILYNPCAAMWCFIKNMIFVIGSKSHLIKFLSLFFYTFGRYFHAKIFKVEKITHLLPYENLSKIFTYKKIVF